MAASSTTTTHPVSLPSIHEMFPAHLLRPEDEYNGRHKYQEAPRTRCSSYPPVVQNLPQTRPHSHHPESIAHDLRLHESDSRLPHAAYPRKRSASQIYSFDILRSDPMNSSLQHLTSSGSLPNHHQHLHHHLSSPQQQQHLGPAFRVSVPPTAAAANIHHNSPGGPHSRAPQATDSDSAVPTMISFPVSRPSASKPSPTEDNASDDDTPGDSAGKKHICPTCFKRFNRPSSLRIHVNTHTGATPFRCPWPNCGREFNVNSNMRRHYRNHTTPGFSRAQPPDTRRKRRRVDTLSSSSSSIPSSAVDKPHQATLMPPIAHFSPSDESEYESDTREMVAIEKRDELVAYRKKAPAYNLTQSMARVTVTTTPQHHEFPPYGATSRYHHQRQQQQQYHPYGDARSFHSESSPSSSSSSLPSPALQPASMPRHPYHSNNNTKRDHKYNPSAPYMHSLADTRVSTALRPAYHS